MWPPRCFKGAEPIGGRLVGEDNGEPKLDKQSSAFGKRVVLIDDDPIFAKLFDTHAQRGGVQVDCFTSLDSMSPIRSLSQYHYAVVDYDLGSMTGVEVGEYLHHIFSDLPMVLISHSDREPGMKGWPSSIRGFVHKSRGVKVILAKIMADSRWVAGG